MDLNAVLVLVSMRRMTSFLNFHVISLCAVFLTCITHFINQTDRYSNFHKVPIMLVLFGYDVGINVQAWRNHVTNADIFVIVLKNVYFVKMSICLC